MTEILIQGLLALSIIAVVLLIANLIRSFKILTDISETTSSIKSVALSVSRVVTTWNQSAKNIAEFVGEITSYLSVFKKNNKKEAEKPEEK